MRLALGVFLASTSRAAIATVTTFDSSNTRFDSTSYTFDRDS